MRQPGTAAFCMGCLPAFPQGATLTSLVSMTKRDHRPGFLRPSSTMSSPSSNMMPARGPWPNM